MWYAYDYALISMLIKLTYTRARGANNSALGTKIYLYA